MKLRYCFEIVKIDDKSIAVPIGDNAAQVNGVLECNETAGLILELLKSDTSEADVVSELKSRYDAPEGVIADAVHEFMMQLESKNWLE